MRHIEFTVTKDYDGKKVLAFLRGSAKLSSRLVNSLKRCKDGITNNGCHARTIDIIHEGDLLAVNIPDSCSEIEPIHYPLDIAYEDDDVIVINKPAGLAMHPTHNHQGDTLANAVVSYFNEKDRDIIFRAIGRLDKGTSGLVLCALNKYAASRLSGNFNKVYYAVVEGEFTGSGTIDKPIYRPDPMKTLRWAGDVGDDAVTHWTALSTDGKNSLLEIHLETGRTHQIRVHFAWLGFPLCGDDMYGSEDKRIGRAALHCGKLSFIHPVSGENITLTADFPEDFKSILPSKTEKN